MPGGQLRTRLSAARHYVDSHFPRFGSLRRLYPVNASFGLGAGTPIDRYYIERFLGSRSAEIRGRVLEAGDREYTTKFGSAVTKSDILDVREGARGATVIADISNCPHVPSATFDCIVLTQTLHYVYDMKAAVSELYRLLAPGGHLLCTVPGISQISRDDMELWGDRWRLTSLSAQELFATAFAPDETVVETYGNVFSSICFLEGIVAERLRCRELDTNDGDYQLLVAVDAHKPVQ